MPNGFIAVVFGGLLMRVRGSVAGQHGRLLVRRGSSTVGVPRFEMALCGGMMSCLGAFERLFGALVGVLHGQCGRRSTVRQIGSPLL
jgi:hypothetical protein